VALVAGTVAVTSYLDQPDEPPAAVAQQTADLEPVEGNGTGRVDLVNHDGRVTLTFTVRDLPETEKGQYYYGWLLEPSTNKMLPLGQLGPGGTATFEVPESLVDEYHSIDVSLEDDDGDPAHSVTSVLRASYEPEDGLAES
jgi:hypothetical protein